jgi:hypothetical protein
MSDISPVIATHGCGRRSVDAVAPGANSARMNGQGPLSVRARRSVSHGQPGDERRVLGRGATHLDDGAESPRVACQKRVGVEPEPGKDFRAVNAICTRFQIDESPVPKHEPADFVRLNGAHYLFQHADALVILKLRPKVGVARCMRNRDKQLGNAVDEPPISPGPPSEFRGDAQQDIGLRLAL